MGSSVGSGGGTLSFKARIGRYGGLQDFIILETSQVSHIKSTHNMDYDSTGTGSSTMCVWGYTNTLPALNVGNPFNGTGLSDTVLMDSADFDVNKSYTYVVACSYSSNAFNFGYDVELTL